MGNKENFVNTLFGTEKVNGANGKKVDVRIDVKNDALRKHANRLFNKYSYFYNYDKNTFMSDYMLIAYNVVANFEIQDGGSWDGMAAGSDKANIARIIKAIKTTIDHRIVEMNTDGYRTKRKVVLEDGTVKTVNAVITVKMDSIDRMMENEDGGEMQEQIESAQSYWSKGETGKTTFASWFDKNKTNILTKSQIALLDKLNSIQYYQAKDVLSEEELLKELDGETPESVRLKLRKITARIAKKWAKEKGCDNEAPTKKETLFKPAENGETIYLYVDANGALLQEK